MRNTGRGKSPGETRGGCERGWREGLQEAQRARGVHKERGEHNGGEEGKQDLEDGEMAAERQRGNLEATGEAEALENREQCGKQGRPPHIKYLTGDDKSNGNYCGKNIIRNLIEVKQNLHNTAN